MNLGFTPEAYTFVGALYHYAPTSDDYADYAASIIEDVIGTFTDRYDVNIFEREDAKRLANPEGRYATRGTCDHCGAHFNYGAVFRNTESGEHLVVGHICATDKMSLTTGEYNDALLRRAMKSARTKIKMKATREKNRAILESGELGPELTNGLNYPHPMCESIRNAFFDGRELTAKMKAAVIRAYTEDWYKVREAPEPDPVPIPDLPKRSTFTGTVLGLKDKETMYGVVTKMVFRDDRGFKLYGTVPSALFDGEGELRGSRVKFDAAIEVSNDDPCFGFFSRPTKASRLAD